MGYKKFQITVDSPTGSYYAGSTVTGKVILVLEKPKKVRGLRIKFKGKARVNWHEKNLHDDDRRRYHAEEDYFLNKYYIIGSENGEVEIPAGENIYPFSTTLPTELPTPFDSIYGFVRYSIKAVIDRPWKIDEKTTFILNIVAPLDLNLLPQVKEPVKEETKKTFLSLAGQSGPLTLTGTIPFSGYIPGQTIVANFEVENMSNIRISEVTCKLKQERKFISKYPRTKEKIDKVDLVNIKLPGVSPNGFKCWTESIQIPQTSVLNLNACSIIKVQYYVQLKAYPEGPHLNLTLKIPITLGTEAIYQANDFSQPTAPSLYPPLPSAPPLEDFPEKWGSY